MADQSPRRGEARRDEAELCALSATAEILARGKTLRKFCLKSKPRNLGEKDGMFLTMCTSSRSIRCRRHDRSPGDVAAASPVPVQMWQRRAQSRCRCGHGASPVPAQMWEGRAQSRCRCGRHGYRILHDPNRLRGLMGVGVARVVGGG